MKKLTKISASELIIAENIKKIYSSFINMINNLADKKNDIKNKRQLRIILITKFLETLINANIKFTYNVITFLINISSRTYKNIIKTIKSGSNYVPYRGKKYKNSKQGNLKIENKHPELLVTLEKFINNNRTFVDSSMQEEKRYVAVTLKDIKEYLEQRNLGFEVPSIKTISRILKEHFNLKFSPSKKDKVLKKNENTNVIFDNIKEKTEQAFQNDNIEAISLDDKTAFKLGNFSNGGKSWFDLHVLDHDYASDLVLIFGYTDIKTHDTSIFCNTSKSTANFKIDCIKKYIEKKLKTNPKFDTLYLFLDNGPENAWKRTQWRFLTIQIALEYGITIELIYYPPYHSKYNLIERYWGTLQKNFGREVIDTINKLILVIKKTVWYEKNAEVTYVRRQYSLGFKKKPEKLKILEDKYCEYKNSKIKRWSIVINPQKIKFG